MAVPRRAGPVVSEIHGLEILNTKLSRVQLFSIQLSRVQLFSIQLYNIQLLKAQLFSFQLPGPACVCVCVRAFYTIRFALSKKSSHIVDLSLINKGTGYRWLS